MYVELYNNEKLDIQSNCEENAMNEEEINIKYEEGYNRIVTEQGSIKLPLLKTIFNQENYMLQPEFQRRLTWDDKKRSKLIESFIINIPIPPVFIFEKDFDSYEVMDGLQRISSIIIFYNDGFELQGLEEWSELNGLKYSELPKKIREGIDRRQLSTITLLKESSQTPIKAEKMKKMVFERLNTGGVKLEPQEIRNALYDGEFNKLCIRLSRNEDFRRLWNIKPSQIDNEENIETEKESDLFANDQLYRRMYDVELVLRFFAMRHVDNMQGKLSSFLDNILISGNQYDTELINNLATLFQNIMKLAYSMFEGYAFCQYKEKYKSFVWTKPQKSIYDPMCLVLTKYYDKLNNKDFDTESNIALLEEMYKNNLSNFDGKRQSKTDIILRCEIIEKVVIQIIGE